MERFELFKKFSNSILSYAIDAAFGSNAKDKGSSVMLLLAIILALILLIVFLYAGAEVVYLLSRNKFGTKGVKRIRVLLGSFAFLGLAYFCYNVYRDYYGASAEVGSQISYLYASITFVFVGVVVLAKGLTAGGEDDKDVIDPIYRGNSWLLGGLVKEGVKQSIVQDIAEPLLFLALGFCLFSYNYIWGLPFIFCAISCWFHLTVEAVFGFFKERKELSNEGLVYTQNRRVSKAIS